MKFDPLQFRGVEYYKGKTNGCVFDRGLNILTDIDYPDLYYYDREAAEWAVTFIESVGTITEDGHYFKKGDPIRLLDWQIQTICNVFGIKQKENGLRRYWDVLQLMPKKQGKSPFSAFVSLLLLCGEGQGTAEIFSIACDKTQARIIHNNSKKLVKASPFLSHALVVRDEYIFHPPTESKFWVTSSVENSKHGPNLSGLMFDEPHAYTKWGLVEILEQGIAARPEPLKIFTSTGGIKNSPFFNKKYKPAQKILRRELRNDTEIVFMYEPDIKSLREIHGDKWGPNGVRPWWAIPDVWADINPSYGVTVTERYLENEVTKVKNGTRSLNHFLQMHLNVFTGVGESWSIYDKWKNLEKIAA